jgi:hypothetical protein
VVIVKVKIFKGWLRAGMTLPAHGKQPVLGRETARRSLCLKCVLLKGEELNKKM